MTLSAEETEVGIVIKQGTRQVARFSVCEELRSDPGWITLKSEIVRSINRVGGVRVFSDPPCRSLPKDQWCDKDGAGGFMGHTCYRGDATTETLYGEKTSLLMQAQAEEARAEKLESDLKQSRANAQDLRRRAAGMEDAAKRLTTRSDK